MYETDKLQLNLPILMQLKEATETQKEDRCWPVFVSNLAGIKYEPTKIANL